MSDDIEVFKNPSSQKPNILFVFDRSGSMDFELDDPDPTAPVSTRGEVLKEAFKELLEANKNIINAGFGPFYESTTSGVKWPIGDLTANANSVDPAIPEADNITSQDIVEMIYDTSLNGGGTNIVDALYESALYFRGGPVEAGNPSDPDRFAPDEWDVLTNSYSINNKHAPHPSSYTPQNAFGNGPTTLEIQTGSCNDFSLAGTVVGDNHCTTDPEIINYDSCSYVDLEVGVGTECIDWDTTCLVYSTDGFCLNEETTCVSEIPKADTPAHYQCTYYKENLVGSGWDGASYVSPISDPCQINAIVLLSDGVPNTSTAQDKIKALTGVTGNCQGTGAGGDCALELAEFLFTQEQIPTIPNSTVKTYTVGFANEVEGQQYLENIALAGGGEFFPAGDATQLNEAFDAIVSAISSISETFTAVSVDVNKAKFSSSNRAYFSLFQPSARRRWSGNVKGYFVNETGLLDIWAAPATEETPEGTIFTETSQSFWSVEADGAGVMMGGASSKLDPLNRTLYTDTASSIPSGGLNLTDAAHEMVESNFSITTAMLGGADRDILDWIQERALGDPLHTQPMAITYSDRTVVYIMTNQGFIHAFDATNPTGYGDTSGGQEMWAYMPQELLSNMIELRTGSFTGEHIYGLDGALSRHVEESVLDNGVVESGEKAVLYFGMRRGGGQYYALDVSNPLAPKLLWKIDSSISGFERLGQSWSRMSLTSMKINGSETRVLIFGGGYDDDLDGSTTRTSIGASGLQVSGNDVFIIEADTGDLVWNAKSASVAGMDYAIPADLTIIDTNRDGLTDRLYFGDLGGQLWRADFPDGEAKVTTLISLEKMADFGASGEFHPFFYPPSVALIENDPNPYIALSVGSGSRDNPLNRTSQNAVFMVKDHNVYQGAPDDTSTWPVQSDDLYDATDNYAGSQDVAVAAVANSDIKDAEGWKIDLEPGEKVLSETVVFQNKLLFTTFLPIDPTATADVCSVAKSSGRFYSVDVRNATPTNPLTGSGDDPLTTDDRFKEITTHGIPGPATIVFPEDSNTADIYVGQEQVGQESQELKKVLWYQRR